MTTTAHAHRGVAEAPVPLWRSDASGRRIAVNRAWLELTGRDERDELGEGWQESIHPGDRDRYLDALHAATRERSGFELEYRIRPARGGIVWLLDRAVPVIGHDGGFLGHSGASTDVTELKQVEAELREAQKMDAIERLAGGVAHGFNNLLTTVVGYADLVARTLEEGDARLADLDEIRSAAERGAALAQQLLALGRGHTLRPAIVDLNDVVTDATARLHRTLGPEIELRTQLRSRRGLVRIDPWHLDQAITSLAVNARDAMPDGGVLSIETADDETSVVLVVSDTGVGIDAALRPHLFEPFFTTKDPGTGTGLGLASVHGTVKQSGGRIDVHSEPGRGARFTIYLPKATEPDSTGALPLSPLQEGVVSTILVAEDEPSVRRLAEQILSQHGFLVFSAPTAEEALSLVTDGSLRIDLLVTDIVMPGMSGLELAERLVHLQPQLRVIYISGYADEAAVRLTTIAPAGFLAKPFTPHALVTRVSHALSAAAVA